MSLMFPFHLQPLSLHSLDLSRIIVQLANLGWADHKDGPGCQAMFDDII